MKEWKYRFKRGLASFLAVGMIAGGMGVATCLPVYAEEAADEAAIPSYSQEVYTKARQDVLDGLKNQISDMFNRSGDGEAKFTVIINFKDQGPRENNIELREAVAADSTILQNLLKEYSSELFWYNNKYTCKSSHIANSGTVTATFDFEFEVKSKYRAVPDNPASISIDTIKDIHSEVGEAELNDAIEEVYSELQKNISDMVNGDGTVNGTETASYTINIKCRNTEMAEKLKVLVPDIVIPRLLKECSTDLFWYDESSNLPSEPAPYSCTSRFKGEANGTMDFKFMFAVKKEYGFDSATSINLWVVRDIKNKIDNILVAENAGLSNYEILCRYRDALCDTYPNDISRYTQAFQYFCDQTFTSKTTRCCTVTGTVKEKGTEDGMPGTWNIVLVDGKNYLVDMVRHASGRNGEFFLVGAQLQEDGAYVIGNGTKYIPDKSEIEAGTPVPTSILKYKPEQTGFRFVSEPTGSVGEVLVLKVEGNCGKVRFVSSNPSAAAIETKAELGNNVALIHLNDIGATRTVAVEIQAIAEETDAYAETIRKYTMFIPAKTPDIYPGDGEPSGGNIGGSGSGGGTPGGGSIGGGYMIDDSTSVRELLPQTDFMFHSGTSKIVKSVGAADFTITASGQVKGSTVTYASSEPSVATVDANTGTVHVVGPGTTKISATASETTIHRAVTYEYELEVQ